MMSEAVYIEVVCQQINHFGERICGDVFLSRRIKEEGRTLAVLSDGLGSGVKANLLATLTATMAINFAGEHKKPQRIAEIIMNTLPVCSERKISYSTFTIVDIEHEGQTLILQYDNPDCIVIRNGKPISLDWQFIELEGEKNKGKEIRCATYQHQKEDRILVCSDGVAQSGLGQGKYLFGWEIENVAIYAAEVVRKNATLSGQELAAKVVNKALQNDNYHAKDDTSCSVLYFRQPRKLLICTGPPFEKDKDTEYAQAVAKFDGKKILCGATTADIISRELKLDITDSFEFEDNELPPISFADGIDLITEGILTLSKAAKIIQKFDNNTHLGKGPADLIVKFIRESDEIYFIIGTRINIAHQDPNLPIELEIRRTVVKRLAQLLEEKFLKEVHLRYI